MLEISPPVLFFFLGMMAAAVRSGLRVPQPVTEVLSLYLLWAIGFRGGVELRAGGLGREEIFGLGVAVLLAFTVPLWVYPVMKRKLAAAEHVDLAAVTPTGGGGVRVVEKDVQAYLASAPKASPLAEKIA